MLPLSSVHRQAWRNKPADRRRERRNSLDSTGVPRVGALCNACTSRGSQGACLAGRRTAGGRVCGDPGPARAARGAPPAPARSGSATGQSSRARAAPAASRPGPGLRTRPRPRRAAPPPRSPRQNRWRLAGRGPARGGLQRQPAAALVTEGSACEQRLLHGVNGRPRLRGPAPAPALTIC